MSFRSSVRSPAIFDNPLALLREIRVASPVALPPPTALSAAKGPRAHSASRVSGSAEKMTVKDYPGRHSRGRVSLRWPKRVAAIALVFASMMLPAGAFATAGMSPLRVCSDANNLPFSNMRGQGFENAVARLLAQDLHRDIQFVWLPEPFLAQKILRSGTCDITTGITAPSALMVPTVPYYRSTYVFVSRRDRHIRVSSLTDRTLASYRIGAEIIGEADAAAPPAEELVRRGLVRNIVGFSPYSHPLTNNPSAELITAVERSKVDLAIAWGPVAGYFAKASPVPLAITPICPSTGDLAAPVAFDISMGVRRGDSRLRDRLNQMIAQRHKQIRELLQSYGVPLLDRPDARADCR
jgi:mxaJ protein